MDLDFTEDEIQRYSRHILLQEVGGIGQAKLKAARVLVIGAGGLGSPLMLYLAAAGIGTIGIVDDDVVELSNLQRQVAHTTDRIGMSKVASAAQAATAINPDLRMEPHATRLDADNALDLISRYDIVCDGTDNFATRFLVADACALAKRTLVSAAVLRFEGQLSVFKPHEGGPCYRCLYPEAPPPGTVPTCSEAGVLGAVTGVMGTLQATEVLKEILRHRRVPCPAVCWSGMRWHTRFRTIKLRPDPSCALCGPRATIKDLSAHGVPGRTSLCRLNSALGVLLLSGAHDRAHYAFVVASGAAALGRQVVLFATNRGCLALCRDWSGLPDAGRDERIQARGVAGLDTLRDGLRRNGGAHDRLRGGPAGGRPGRRFANAELWRWPASQRSWLLSGLDR